MWQRITEIIDQHLLVIKQKNDKDELIISVYYKYIPVCQFNYENLVERKLAAVQLIEQKNCNLKQAAQICGFHRNSIRKFCEIKGRLGIESLISDNRGLKKPLKYSADVCQVIEQFILEHDDYSDQHIARLVSQKIQMDISRSAVVRVRKAKLTSAENNEHVHTKDQLVELSRIAESMNVEKNNQIELNFEADVNLRQKTEELAQLEPLQSAVQTEQNLINRLQQGLHTPFAGSLMHYFFLQEINFRQLFNCLSFNKGDTYQYIDILFTLYFSIAHDIKSIEALKLINPSDFGFLLGLDRSPDKDVIRKKLKTMSNCYPSQELIDRFARTLLENQRIDDEVFFIDGHFLPYYGLNVIAKGYYTVRRLAMRGNELYFISDLNGRPLFSITESNEIDFRPIISQAADKLIEFGINRPILTFDRGGYGIRFFRELNEKADFVTWAKYLKNSQLDRIEEASFTQCAFVNGKGYLVHEQWRDVSESLQTAKKEGREKPVKIKLRLVVILNVKTGKKIGIFTNNKDKLATDIVFYMLSRWGDSENLYKEFMAKFNLNYHPGYDINELQNQPLVDNPDIPMIKKAIKILQKETARLSQEQLDSQNRFDKRPDKRLARKLSSISRELEEKKNEIKNFEEKLKTLPDKISIVEVLNGKKMSRCDLEKKKLYDLMQYMHYHSLQRLEDIFMKYYKDSRDIKPVLRMIVTKAGYLKLIGDTLIVLLDKIELQKHRIPAEQLCQQLNKFNISLDGRIKVKLFFHIAKF